MQNPLPAAFRRLKAIIVKGRQDGQKSERKLERLAAQAERLKKKSENLRALAQYHEKQNAQS